jgi:hypothetical protein
MGNNSVSACGRYSGSVDLQAKAIVGHSGEILKFVGDGLLSGGQSR